MPEIQREHRRGDTGSQHSPALGKGPIQDSTSYVLENVTLIIMTQKVLFKNYIDNPDKQMNIFISIFKLKTTDNQKIQIFHTTKSYNSVGKTFIS